MIDSVQGLPWRAVAIAFNVDGQVPCLQFHAKSLDEYSHSGNDAFFPGLLDPASGRAVFPQYSKHFHATSAVLLNLTGGFAGQCAKPGLALRLPQSLADGKMRPVKPEQQQFRARQLDDANASRQQSLDEFFDPRLSFGGPGHAGVLIECAVRDEHHKAAPCIRKGRNPSHCRIFIAHARGEAGTALFPAYSTENSRIMPISSCSRLWQWTMNSPL